MLNVSVRPQPAAVAAVSVLAALGKLHPTMHHSLPARSGERHHLAKSSTNFRLGTVSRINSKRTERAVSKGQRNRDLLTPSLSLLPIHSKKLAATQASQSRPARGRLALLF